MAKYDPLRRYLENLPEDQNEVNLTFDAVEKIIDAGLPYSAHEYPAWWSNEKNGVHVAAHAWMGAGWKVESINQREHWVRFVRR